MNEHEGLLSSEDVAEIFGVDRRTVNRWARGGKLKAIRTPGNHWRFDPNNPTIKQARKVTR